MTTQPVALDPEPTPSRPAHLKSVRATGSWQGSMTTRVSIRDFSFVSDEPVAVGGTNSAPTPMEFVAGAVNACITVVIETVAAELGIGIHGITTSSAAQMDVRGFAGTADVSPHFQNYALAVSVVTPTESRVLTELQSQVEKRCPALNLVRDAGVPLELHWNFQRPEASAEEAGR